jgi:hypothetical protein
MFWIQKRSMFKVTQSRPDAKYATDGQFGIRLITA